MPRTKDRPPIPDILGVVEDRHRNARRTARTGRRSASDVLSVYAAGGPRYQLGRRVYTFAPPIGVLIAAGTLDRDLQQGRIDGLCAVFQGDGLVRKAPGSRGEVTVSLGGERLNSPCLKQLDPADAQGLVRILRDMSAIRDVGVVGQMRRASLLLQAVAAYCEAPLRKGEGEVHREAMRLRHLIQARAFEDIALSRLYRELDLSSTYAGTLFKRAYGVTPVAYRAQLRLWRARELLVSTQRNVTQTAQAVGFTDPLYFSRLFRKHFGVPPSRLIYDFGNVRKQEAVAGPPAESTSPDGLQR